MKKLIKCIVTGGAGFIGSHLCDELIKKGYEVFCIDNLLTGSEKNIIHLKYNPYFHFILHDITKPFPPDSEFSIPNSKFIYHLASPASPVQYRKYSLETLMVNSIGTKNMLDIARQNNSRFLLASTSEIYGNPLKHPQKETYYGNVNTVGPRSCYDEAKRFAEAITMEYIRKFDINGRIIRIFNTYGPRMQEDDGRVVSNFITQAITHKPLTIYGDGNQTRSFCYVSDMVIGLISAMEEDNTKAEVINLGNPDEQTINDIGKLILKLTGSKSQLTKATDKHIDDPDKRKPDISKANKLLDWYPTVSLINGLKDTISYFQNI